MCVCAYVWSSLVARRPFLYKLMTLKPRAHIKLSGTISAGIIYTRFDTMSYVRAYVYMRFMTVLNMCLS